MRHSSHEQGLSKLEHLTKHFCSKTTQASLHFQMALHWAQFNAGVSFPILHQPHPKLPHFESVWFKDLRDFLSKHSLSVHIQNPGTIPHQRQHDMHLMDIIITLNFRPCEIKRSNYCRLYLNVTLLSDIVTADGMRFNKDMYNGIRKQSHNQVHQQKPNKTTWAIWRRGLNSLTFETEKLKQPLGAWLVHHNQLRHPHPLYSPSTNKVYHQEQNKWYHHQ